MNNYIFSTQSLW